ncbi:hypothetical protein [Agriterribacter sp.]|uniref:hypothetical protein n=1 Tax=Agriterribacter sp. TaxID=2821509 RepID=UPI002BFF9FA2|nr:hypothetical protein [Agriterribacter sp.]HRP58018.1 hypothetical protein [Agriterribacter sp.]
MKRIFVIALIMLYGASSSGVTFQLHYCCGKFKNIEWAPVKDNGCGSDHSMGKKPCCEYKAVSFSEDDDHTSPELAVKAFKANATAIPAALVSFSGGSVSYQYLPIILTAQTLQSKPPLFLLNRVFRI